jgi:signal transduction histidine kinase
MRYTRELNESKDMFLAILGHDLRTPLSTVITSSQFLLDADVLAEPHRTLALRSLRSARRMNTLVADLLDFTRSRLGSGVPIVRRPMDLGGEATHAVDEVSGAFPSWDIKLETNGDLRGEWDGPRIGQVLINLLVNAVQHGSSETPVTVRLIGRREDVVLSVHNRGTVIAARDLPGLFLPFKRLKDAETHAAASLGLGLYVAERIATAHHGTISVMSTPREGTTFTVVLPRVRPALASDGENPEQVTNVS